MKIFGFEVSIKRAAQRALTAVTGAWTTIWDWYPGAWQQNNPRDTNSVLAYWAVYACITTITSDIGKLRLKLVEQVGGIWQEVDRQSPFLAVLRKPNRYQTRQQFFVYWFSSLLIQGNTYVLKVRDGRGVVVALYVLDPTLVTPLVSEDGGVFYQLRRDNLSGITGEQDVIVPASEIIHDRMVTLHHPLVGVSPLFACSVAATQGLAIQANSQKFFSNDSMPRGIISVPGSLSPEKAAELKAAWASNYSGENYGKTAVLADKLEYKPLALTALDSQLIEQLKMTAEMVCSAFRVPAYKVGAGTLPNTTNVAALDQQYYSGCLQSLIESAEALLDEGLELKGMGVEFDLDGLIRMDPMAQMEFVEKGVKASVIAPNDGRAMFNLPPVAGGDSPYLQQQNYSLAALAKRDAQEDPFGTAKPAPAPTPEPAQPEPAHADDVPDDEARAFLKSVEPDQLLLKIAA